MDNKTKKFEVLIVDDCKNVREMLEYILSKGFTVYQADGANSAKSLIDTKNLDLIISDMEMPNGDGRKLLSIVKASDKDNTPLIYYSSLFDSKDTSSCLVPGAVACISKNDPIDKLIEVIDRVAGTSLSANTYQK